MIKPRDRLVAVTAGLLAICLGACSLPPAEEASVPKAPAIESPASGAEYRLGQVTLFRATRAVDWHSSLDGFLGTGTTLTARLSLGSQTVSIAENGSVLASVSVRVLPPEVTDRYRLDVQGLSSSTVIPPGTYTPVLVSFSRDDCSVSVNPSSYGPAPTELSYLAGSPVRGGDLSLWNRPVDTPRPAEKKAAGRALASDGIGSERSFRFVNLETGNGAGQPVSARLAWSSPGAELWLDEDATLSESAVSGMGNYLESMLLPHHKAAWGGWTDIDGNGKLTVLCTSRLNDSGAAVGFFNPADFYSGNPASNEMDILYVACPDTGGENPDFSVSSIYATLAHELQHLSGYSNVCRQALEDSRAEPVLEETFLEEGLSHLAENLAGYGTSGGNVAFVARYLAKPSKTPLDTAYSLLYGDTVERRGGMVLLLSWLYESRCERGEGSAFLKSIYDSRNRGWTRLEEVMGTDKEELLEEFALYLSRPRTVSIRYHPRTGEPITIDPWCGDIATLGRPFSLRGPIKEDLSAINDVAPGSLLFGIPFSGTANTEVVVKKNGGSGFLRMVLVRDYP